MSRITASSIGLAVALFVVGCAGAGSVGDEVQPPLGEQTVTVLPSTLAPEAPTTRIDQPGRVAARPSSDERIARTKDLADEMRARDPVEKETGRDRLLPNNSW